MREKNIENEVLLLTQLRQMEIIDISEGRRLGFISDIIFDDDLRKIESFVIPPQSGIFSLFKKKDEIHLKWEQIKVIGVDIILVDISGKKANDIKSTQREIERDIL
jgi:YlmC/YmxH family sporulation protein